MNLIIEVIGGVAYAVEEGKYGEVSCMKCLFYTHKSCHARCTFRHSAKSYYRRLTAKEREEVTKAMGRGME